MANEGRNKREKVSSYMVIIQIIMGIMLQNKKKVLKLDFQWKIIYDMGSGENHALLHTRDRL